MLSRFDIEMLKVAKTYSTISRDRTKIGAVIQANDISVWGINGLPPGMHPDHIHFPNKNKYVVHAETRAILKYPQAGSLFHPDSCIYIWGLAPCTTCATLIAEKGIRRCIAVVAAESKNKEIWEEEAEISKFIFDECDIEYHFLTLKEFLKEEENANKCYN
jgi:deoxycytidylate deaminase